MLFSEIWLTFATETKNKDTMNTELNNRVSIYVPSTTEGNKPAKRLREHAGTSASTFKELQIVLDKVTGILGKFSNNIPQEHSDEFMKLVGREWNALWESLSSIEETVMHINNPRGLSDGDLTFDDLS